MGGILSSFLPADLFDRTLNFGRRQANYIWRLESNLHDLEAELKKLIGKRNDLQTAVENAKQQQPAARVGPTEQVTGWLRRLEEMQTKFMELQQEEDQEMDRLCLGGFCSKDLRLSYKFGIDVVKLKDEVIRVKDERGNIENIVQRLPEGAAVPKPLEATIVGRESILDRVWRCITDQEKNNRIIGLYGTGGVSKTTLLKQVNNKFCSEEHDFDVVIWSVVPREPNLKQIQWDIGKRIGFSNESWQDKSFEEKTSDITTNLSQKKFVLLLDDIWESKINLTDLGVPHDSRSRIVFTTRLHGTCGEMRADERFEVSYLGDDDAWKLYHGVVGRYVLDKHPDIPALAKAMARQCHGLPLALKTVGNAMASKEYPEEWRHAIQIISTSASKFKDMEKQVLSRLKFGYDRLP